MAIVSKFAINGVKVLNWNINSIGAHKSRLLDLVYSNDYDVIHLQETEVTAKSKYAFKIPGYELHCSGRNNKTQKRGVCTYVRSSIPQTRVFHDDYAKYEYVAMVIRTNAGLIELQNHYVHGEKHEVPPKIVKINSQAEELIVTGDFNSYSKVWGSPTDDQMISAAGKRGILLEDIISKADLMVLKNNRPSTTHGSHIDLCMVSQNLFPITKVDVTKIHSDVHFAQNISIGRGKYHDKSSFVPRFKFDEADWPKFFEALEKRLIDLDSLNEINAENLDEKAERLAEVYSEVANHTIPKTKFHPKPWRSWYWNEECTSAVRRSNWWRRAHKKGTYFPGFSERKAEALADEEEVIDRAKRNAWAKICASISLANNSRVGWMRIKFMKGGGCQQPRAKVLYPQEEANKLANTFAQRTSSNNLSQSVRNCMQDLAGHKIKTILDAVNTPDPEYDMGPTGWEMEETYSVNKKVPPPPCMVLRTL